MLSLTAFLPHPPIIIPTIGSPQDLERVKKTISAMKRIGQDFSQKDIQALFIVSPHSPIDYQVMNINMAPHFQGDFRLFGEFESEYSFENDLELLKKLVRELEKKKFPFQLINQFFLDHGLLVPLHYLTENSKKKAKVIPLSYSLLSPKDHFEYGKIISSVIKETSKKIAFIASGDLSHRLIPEAPAGYSPKGKIFDSRIISLLKKKKVDEILNLKEELINEAGECGYRSLLILLGVLNEYNWQAEILSYEGPFGVGYLVANFKIS